RPRRAGSRRVPGVAGGPPLRPRRDHRQGHREGAGRRRPSPRDARQRGAPARSRARSLPAPDRRAEDAGAHRPHAQDGQAAEELMHVEGRGLPLLVIPGVQGRWEWMRPGIRALASRFRVATYSLAGDREDVLPTSATCFDALVRQALNAMARAGWTRAAVLGTSYGALIATRLA